MGATTTTDVPVKETHESENSEKIERVPSTKEQHATPASEEADPEERVTAKAWLSCFVRAPLSALYCCMTDIKSMI